MALVKWYEVEIDDYANLHKEPSEKVKVILEDSLRYILDVWEMAEDVGMIEDWKLIIDISDYAVISLPAESWQTPEAVKAWLEKGRLKNMVKTYDEGKEEDILNSILNAYKDGIPVDTIKKTLEEHDPELLKPEITEAADNLYKGITKEEKHGR